jgi:hypothetical protein
VGTTNPGHLRLRTGKELCLGAAIQALGLQPQYGYAELRRTFPTLRQSLVEAIVQRNDNLSWTREQIADWLVQSQLDCAAAQEVVPEFPVEQIFSLDEPVTA